MFDRFVATDADGLQHHEGYRRRWPLPAREADGWRPGDVVEPDEHGTPVVLDAGQLLDQLGECVFAAEPAGQAGAGPTRCRYGLVGEGGGDLRARLRRAHLGDRPRQC